MMVIGLREVIDYPYSNLMRPVSNQVVPYLLRQIVTGRYRTGCICL